MRDKRIDYRIVAVLALWLGLLVDRPVRWLRLHGEPPAPLARRHASIGPRKPRPLASSSRSRPALLRKFRSGGTGLAVAPRAVDPAFPRGQADPRPTSRPGSHARGTPHPLRC